jgi:hypothetical protein
MVMAETLKLTINGNKGPVSAAFASEQDVADLLCAYGWSRYAAHLFLGTDSYFDASGEVMMLERIAPTCEFTGEDREQAREMGILL